MTHEIVWIDHREARVLPLDADAVVVRTPQHVHRRHPKGESGAKEHPEDAKHFFHAVAQALAGATHVLVVGPSTARLELAHYAHEHDRALEAKIVGSETVDHPTDPQLVAYAKTYFNLA